MIKLDMMGKACPIPVIETKKSIAKHAGEKVSIQVLIDNEIACENLTKMAQGMGFASEYAKQKEGEYIFSLQLAEGEKVGNIEQESKEIQSGFVVTIGQNTMGKGSDELGGILIKGFIYALQELENLPSHVLFFNSGIHLACEGANTLADLIALQEKGCKIFVCGTCLDYYQKKAELAVGEIVNMYTIATTMSESTRLLNL